MKKKFDFSAEMNDTESIKITPKNEYLEEESEFIQLVHGSNTVIYDADQGVDYLNVTIMYRFRYLGV